MLSTGSTQEDRFQYNWNIVDWGVKNIIRHWNYYILQTSLKYNLHLWKYNTCNWNYSIHHQMHNSNFMWPVLRISSLTNKKPKQLWWNPSYHFKVTVTLSMTYVLFSRIIVAKTYHLHYWGRNTKYGLQMHLWMVEYGVPFSGHSTLTSDLVPRIIVSKAYLLYNFGLEIQMKGVNAYWFLLKDLSIDKRVDAWWCICCLALQGLTVGFRLLQYSVVFTVEFLPLFYLPFLSWFIYTRKWFE